MVCVYPLCNFKASILRRIAGLIFTVLVSIMLMHLQTFLSNTKCVLMWSKMCWSPVLNVGLEQNICALYIWSYVNTLVSSAEHNMHSESNTFTFMHKERSLSCVSESGYKHLT